MTAQKHLKQLIRARMEKTGERYAAARRHVLARLDHAPAATEATAHGQPTDQPAHPAARAHLPGSVPATTALRILLNHAGLRAPHTGAPFGEAMLFGLAGGIGIGVFSFYYEREDVASFFIAGRHQWHDDLAYLQGALGALGLEPALYETSGARAAAAQLAQALQHGPCVAWVDAASLPHRAMPASWQGGSYHVVTVYALDEGAQTALIGDLTDEPIAVALADLAQARLRIKKQRNRLLTLPNGGTGHAGPASTPAHDLEALVLAGLRRCHDALLNPTLPGAQNNARLTALRTWGQRLHGGRDAERWERVFRPGQQLWTGLCSIYSFIEHYGTGGGLCRPLFAEFLAEAAEALARADLAALAARYTDLGQRWSQLANAALPDEVATLAEAKSLLARIAELGYAGASADEVWPLRARLGELERQATAGFPLSEPECAELRAGLQHAVLALYEDEVAALGELGALVG